MQFNATELQKQSCFKSCFKAAFEAASKAAQLSATQRSSSYAAFKSSIYRSATQRMCECTYMQLQRSAKQRSAAHHMLRLEATCIYSAVQRSVCVNAP